MLLNGPQIISDHYLHVQCWVLNFMSNTVRIETLLVRVRFIILPAKYYSRIWLERADNRTGRTIKVNNIIFFVSRGKFASVCVEVDLKRLKEKFHRIQYEGLHKLYFHCGKYGHNCWCAQRLIVRLIQMKDQRIMKKQCLLQMEIMINQEISRMRMENEVRRSDDRLKAQKKNNQRNDKHHLREGDIADIFQQDE